MGEPYYRRKGDRIIIEQKLNGKTKYLKTLPPAKVLLETGRLDANKTKASIKDTNHIEKDPQTFGQSILSELPDDDEQRRKIDEILYNLTKE